MTSIPVFAIQKTHQAASTRVRRGRTSKLVATGTVWVDADVVISPDSVGRLIADRYRGTDTMIVFMIIDPIGAPVCLCSIDPAHAAPNIFACIPSLVGPQCSVSIIAVELDGSSSITAAHVERVGMVVTAAGAIGGRLLEYILVGAEKPVTYMAIGKEGLGLAGVGGDLPVVHRR